MALLKIFIYLILFVWPLGELARLQLDTIAVKPLDVVVGITVAIGCVQILRNKLKLQTRYTKAILAFSSIGLVSLLFNSVWLATSELAVAFLYLLRWTSYFMLLPILSQLDHGFKKRLSFILVVEGLLILLFGYLQFFFYPDLRNLFYLGWDEHLYRLFSVFLDPNFTGAFLVLYFLFIGGLLFELVENKASRFAAAHSKHKKILLSVILLLTLIAIFLTFSRSALLMLVVGAGVFLVLIRQKKLIFFLLGAIVVAVLAISPFFYIENTNLFRINSSKARVETTLNAMQVIQDRPILGVGFNTYRYAQQSYGFRPETPKYTSHADAGADNSFLFVLATTGMIGFVIYMLLWSIILRYAYVRRKKTIYGAVVVASVIGLFMNAFFINSLFFPAIMLWIIVLVALLEE